MLNAFVSVGLGIFRPDMQPICMYAVLIAVLSGICPIAAEGADGETAEGAAELAAAALRSYQPIDIWPFMDGIRHWRKRYGRDRNDPLLDPSQIVHIAENLLAYQNAEGGWPNNIDWLAVINPDTVWAIKGEVKWRNTFDNHNTFPQIDYLAKVYTATNLERYRRAAERGLDYIFCEQRPGGGWRGWDVDAITYNDGVMVGIMGLLKDVASGESPFDRFGTDRREKARSALDRAIAATLKCQIVVNGEKTAWCQQHDHETFLPVKARSYELPSICSAESEDIVRFLMEIDAPGPEIVEAVERAVAWFERSKIYGIRLERVKMAPVRFKDYTAKEDLVVVKDPKALPIWTRFYEIETNRPFFCNRDGKKVYSLAEVQQERRTGYGWYTGAPAWLLEKAYPAWKARIRGHSEIGGGGGEALPPSFFKSSGEEGSVIHPIDYTKPVRYELMKGREAVAAIRACLVGYLPVGCLERHGDHLPMGLDVIKAVGVCCLVAQAVGGLCFLRIIIRVSTG